MNKLTILIVGTSSRGWYSTHTHTLSFYSTHAHTHKMSSGSVSETTTFYSAIDDEIMSGKGSSGVHLTASSISRHRPVSKLNTKKKRDYFDRFLTALTILLNLLILVRDNNKQ
jgi:hypothetical protein